MVYIINTGLIPVFLGSRRGICQRIGRELIRHFPDVEQTLPREHVAMDEPTPKAGGLPLPEGHAGGQGHFY